MFVEWLSKERDDENIRVEVVNECVGEVREVGLLKRGEGESI